LPFVQLVAIEAPVSVSDLEKLDRALPSCMAHAHAGAANRHDNLPSAASWRR
jgi:hypothetical protein